MKLAQIARRLLKIVRGGTIQKRSSRTPNRNGPELELFTLEEVIHLEHLTYRITDSVQKNMAPPLVAQFRETAFFMNGRMQSSLDQHEIEFCKQIVILADRCLIIEVFKGRYPDAKWLPRLRKAIEEHKRDINEKELEIFGSNESLFVLEWCRNMTTLLSHMNQEKTVDMCLGV